MGKGSRNLFSNLEEQHIVRILMGIDPVKGSKKIFTLQCINTERLKQYYDRFFPKDFNQSTNLEDGFIELLKKCRAKKKTSDLLKCILSEDNLKPVFPRHRRSKKGRKKPYDDLVCIRDQVLGYINKGLDGCSLVYKNEQYEMESLARSISFSTTLSADKEYKQHIDAMRKFIAQKQYPECVTEAKKMIEKLADQKVKDGYFQSNNINKNCLNLWSLCCIGGTQPPSLKQDTKSLWDEFKKLSGNDKIALGCRLVIQGLNNLRNVSGNAHANSTDSTPAEALLACHASITITEYLKSIPSSAPSKNKPPATDNQNPGNATPTPTEPLNDSNPSSVAHQDNNDDDVPF